MCLQNFISALVSPSVLWSEYQAMKCDVLRVVKPSTSCLGRYSLCFTAQKRVSSICELRVTDVGISSASLLISFFFKKKKMTCNQHAYGFPAPFNMSLHTLVTQGSILWHGHYTSKLGQTGLKASILRALRPSDHRSARSIQICTPGWEQVNGCMFVCVFTCVHQA